MQWSFKKQINMRSNTNSYTQFDCGPMKDYPDKTN